MWRQNYPRRQCCHKRRPCSLWQHCLVHLTSAAIQMNAKGENKFAGAPSTENRCAVEKRMIWANWCMYVYIRIYVCTILNHIHTYIHRFDVLLRRGWFGQISLFLWYCILLFLSPFEPNSINACQLGICENVVTTCPISEMYAVNSIFPGLYIVIAWVYFL